MARRKGLNQIISIAMSKSDLEQTAKAVKKTGKGRSTLIREAWLQTMERIMTS